MPQASDALRAVMDKWFGPEVDCSAPWNFLKSRGYTTSGDKFFIRKPTPNHSINREEFACIRYLIHEWDWGFDQQGSPEWGE